MARGDGRHGAAQGLIAAMLLFVAAAAHAASPADVPKAVIPDLFDPHHRPPKPDLGGLKSIRFLTTDDFPPFHFAMPDGTLAGFDIDLARAICTDLALTCTIQARRFDTLVAQIKAGADDALIAAVANTPATRVDLTFSAPYYTTPARFVTKADSKLAGMIPETLAGHTIGVVAGTAHEAYLRAFFGRSKVVTTRSEVDLRAALKRGAVEAIFGDAIASAVWLNGTDAAGCCAFRDGPFTESHFFGNGVSIAVAKGNIALRELLDYELAKLSAEGTYADLYLKYFPIGFY